MLHITNVNTLGQNIYLLSDQIIIIIFFVKVAAIILSPYS